MVPSKWSIKVELVGEGRLKATWASRESYDVPHVTSGRSPNVLSAVAQPRIATISDILGKGPCTLTQILPSTRCQFSSAKPVSGTCCRPCAAFPPVSEGLSFRFPPMWVEVTLPVYGGNPPPRVPRTLGVSHGSPSSHVRTTHCAIGVRNSLIHTAVIYIYTIYIINWLVVEPPIWKLLVKLDIFPNFRGENKTCLKPPPS